MLLCDEVFLNAATDLRPPKRLLAPRCQHRPARVADCCSAENRFRIENQIVVRAAASRRQRTRVDRSLRNEQRSLMKSTVFRRNRMQYRDQEFRYESENLLELGTEFVRQLADGKQYRQKRSSPPEAP